MSQVPDCLAPTKEDISKLLACSVHTGTRNLDNEMKRYIFKRRNDGMEHPFRVATTSPCAARSPCTADV